jgi:hypothetical protein
VRRVCATVLGAGGVAAAAAATPAPGIVLFRSIGGVGLDAPATQVRRRVPAGVEVTYAGGVVTRISTASRAFRTANGVGVGSTDEQALAAYPAAAKWLHSNEITFVRRPRADSSEVTVLTLRAHRVVRVAIFRAAFE